MKHLERPYLVAITGGIAAGKSIVSKWFEDNHFKVYYADKIGHELFKDQYFIKRIKEVFGIEVIVQNQVDRAKLGQIIFNAAGKRKQLNELLHPKIRKKIQQIIDRSSEKILIFEIPLLFENGLQDAFDLTVIISAKEELRIERIMNRDSIAQDSARKRIDTQMPELEKQELADVKITNNADLETLYLQLDKLVKHINKFENKDVRRIIDL